MFLKLNLNKLPIKNIEEIEQWLPYALTWTYDNYYLIAYYERYNDISHFRVDSHTVAKGTRSAGRIYDTFSENCNGKVKFIVKDHVIVEILDNAVG